MPPRVPVSKKLPPEERDDRMFAGTCRPTLALPAPSLHIFTTPSSSVNRMMVLLVSLMRAMLSWIFCASAGSMSTVSPLSWRSWICPATMDTTSLSDSFLSCLK